MSEPAMTNEPFILRREDVSSFWLVDSLWSVLATADTTGGALSIMDQVMPRGSGPPPHIHPRLHEYFYLLEGDISYQLGDEVLSASAGAFVSVPATTVHGFAVGSETARVLNLYTPGGFIEQISELGTPATELRLPREGDQVPASDDTQDAYLRHAAELNTQRWIKPGEGTDLLAAQRAAPIGSESGWHA